jgi:hypothetical protein
VVVVVSNESATSSQAILGLTGVQNGNVVFDEPRTLNLDAGARSNEGFAFTPTAAGDVLWTATIFDGDADLDEATDVTTVVP